MNRQTSQPARWLRRNAALTRTLLLATLLAASGQASAQTAATDNSATAASAEGVAVFAGGCFWCTESDFDKVPGVLSTTSGYIGGTLADPTYEQVSSGTTGHLEAVQVRFDPGKTSYAKLLEAYWPSIDPITPNQQFCDHGSQYRSAIFYNSPQQQQLVEASKAALVASGRFSQPIVTEILPATTFYPAEEYHQDYYIKNPIRYNFYRSRCGRDDRLAELWDKKA
ncbi:peptide-methionine (S)-S-oxide reductase [Pseudomonas cavernicola]|uniref:Peptide methionine sulfoxide reductase MsrA n=1 Tax=Pseudomonas cavernicola TaxID=2320866 RepID=A0A418XNE2_9PSED|nr:peptide-methionine (S)-S-oxide reductase MsrA [Pseudomonas cavernicola]RJG13990.1 peptide-methionine (S)-S-oxide reductase [Pseudomonas cavernicola]